MDLVSYFIKESLRLRYFICGRKPGVGGLIRGRPECEDFKPGWQGVWYNGVGGGHLGARLLGVVATIRVRVATVRRVRRIARGLQHSCGIWCDNFISSFKRYVGVFDNFLKKKNLEDEEPLPSFSFFGNDVGAREAPG